MADFHNKDKPCVKIVPLPQLGIDNFYKLWLENVENLFKNITPLLIGNSFKYSFFTLADEVQIFSVKSLENILSNKIATSKTTIWCPIEGTSFKEKMECNLDSWIENKKKDRIVLDNKYFLIFLNKNQPIQLEVDVPQKFKDYRSCAKCGKTEKYKWRSHNGKRVANFKVRNYFIFSLFCITFMHSTVYRHLLYCISLIVDFSHFQ